MKNFLYAIVGWIAQVHDYLMRLNDASSIPMTDKQLHFLVIGVLGFVIFLVVHFVFTRLARYSITAISWIYTVTVLLVLTFAIEIGQKVTSTGTMDFGDIVFGMAGFFAIFLVYLVIVGIGRAIARAVRGKSAAQHRDTRKRGSR